MGQLAVSQLRRGLARALRRVAGGDERIVVRRRGQDVAALVPIADLQLLEEMEDLGLYVLAEEARARSEGTLSLCQLRERLGL